MPGSSSEPSSESLRRAEQDSQLLSRAGMEAWVHSIELSQPDLAAVKAAIEEHVTSDTAALLLIPTGPKKLILTLLHAMRRIGAEHGIPLFVRQNADPPADGRYTDWAEIRRLHRASRTVYQPGELARCDLWFPPADVPLGAGQVGRPPVLVMVSGYSRVIRGRSRPRPTWPGSRFGRR